MRFHFEVDLSFRENMKDGELSEALNKYCDEHNNAALNQLV